MALGAVQSGYQETVPAYRRDAGAAGKNGEAAEPMRLIRERMEEILQRVQNGDTEQSIQIGGGSFTVREWAAFLQRFDDAEDAVRELTRERQEKRMEASERAEVSEQAET